MPLKIVYVIGQLGFGGAERQLLELVRHLNRQRYEPVVVSLSEGGGLQGEFEKACEVIVLRKWTKIDISRLPRLIRLFRKIRADIVHGYLSTGVLWGTLAAKCAGVPYTVGGWRLADPDDRMHFKLVNRLIGPLNKLMISNTCMMKDLLISRDGLDAERIEVIPNGVSLKRFENLYTVADAKEKLGIDRDCVTIGNVARFFPQKDHATLLRAVHHLASKGIQIKCILAGDGALRKQAEELALELGIERSVHFLGTRKDVPNVMRAIDIFVLSSRWEGMPNAILEAMACGKPVVATRVGGSPEVVVDGETGILVEAGDPVSLAEAVERVFVDRGLRERMGSQGRRRIETMFTVDRMVERTEDAYETMIKKFRGDALCRQ